ncbi:hypothetical protein F5148DRAFT_244878 [Russula earlei]|uniref:Uncharacterized protein n=1 Tax=Russula earlei TaxID=71964 RepID=A0ACC0U411_9AGAM|nr:hypothetical protein F5148DRAFT_244878 [Russula earlei]
MHARSVFVVLCLAFGILPSLALPCGASGAEHHSPKSGGAGPSEGQKGPYSVKLHKRTDRSGSHRVVLKSPQGDLRMTAPVESGPLTLHVHLNSPPQVIHQNGLGSSAYATPKPDRLNNWVIDQSQRASSHRSPSVAQSIRQSIAPPSVAQSIRQSIAPPSVAPSIRQSIAPPSVAPSRKSGASLSRDSSISRSYAPPSVAPSGRVRSPPSIANSAYRPGSVRSLGRHGSERSGYSSQRRD